MSRGGAGVTGRRAGGVSLVDVARRAGVSTATAGRALGGYGYASEANVERVRAAADELGYRPNRLARGLITGRTQTIGVVAADIASPFYATAIRGIADSAQASGFGVIVTNSDESLPLEQAAVQLLLEKQVDGLIVAPCELTAAPHLAEALAGGCPIVQIDRVARDLRADSVTVDNAGAARACVQCLLDAGHRRIGFVAELLAGEPGDLEGFVRDGGTPPAHGLMPSWQRLAGYLMACRDAGIVPDIGMIRRVGVYSVDAAKAAVLDLLASRRRPTGLFTGDGTMSTGAMEAIRALGLAVPADLSLVCFDDLDWMRFLDGGITAASQPARALGAAAAELLLRRMQGGREPEQHVVIPVPLVERASVARPARRLPETARSKVDNA